MSETHLFESHVEWSGSTGAGFDNYGRDFTGGAVSSESPLKISADPGFAGNPAALNPEQLLLLAASACQLLSFLASAALSRIDVVEYQDSATAEMPVDEKPIRVSRIRLRPKITIAGEARSDRLERLVKTAHKNCFIANSVNSEVVIEPEFIFLRPPTDA